MKITNINAKTLPEAWFLCMQALGEGTIYGGTEHPTHGVRSYVVKHGSRVGHSRLEFELAVVHIEYPAVRPLVPGVPEGVPPPSTQDYVDGYMSYLVTGYKKPSEDYTYGSDLESQIPKIISMYKQHGPYTNQAFMTVGDKDSLDLESPQCLRMIDTRIMYGKLHFYVYFRSWDLWAGFPSNMAAIQILKEFMASEIGVDDGELVAISKGLHLYDDTLDLANKVLNKEAIRRDRIFDTH
jgi:thymidylate synthase